MSLRGFIQLGTCPVWNIFGPQSDGSKARAVQLYDVNDAGLFPLDRLHTILFLNFVLVDIVNSETGQKISVA